MKEHPILFSGPMVQALLADRKFVTRRISESWMKVKVGDRLWVREHLMRPDGDPWLYAADRQPVMVSRSDETAMLIWAHHKQQGYCPSIHMPRWACRILLEAEEDSSRERLWDITEEEAIAEGCTGVAHVRWYEGMKPMLDGTRIRQQSRGLPPATWTEVRPLSEVNGGRDYDPMARTGIEDFRRLWRSLHTDPGEHYEDNPMVTRVGRFHRVTP